MTDDSKDALRAASFEPRAATQSTQEISMRLAPWPWVALAIGAVLLGFVVFILPQLAPTPTSVFSAPGTILEDTQTAPHHRPVQRRRMPERSPFAEAQLAKVRRQRRKYCNHCWRHSLDSSRAVSINGPLMTF